MKEGMYMDLLKTPLYEEHLKCHGKMVEFAGYSLPVQYATGVIKEHFSSAYSLWLI